MRCGNLYLNIGFDGCTERTRQRFNLELSMRETKRGLNIILLDHKTEVS